MEKTGIEFMRDLFDATRDHTAFAQVLVPPELADYAKALYGHYNQSLDLIDFRGRLIKSEKKKTDKTAFTLSGGKDSLATFLMNRDRVNEFDCFHVVGITPYVKEEEYGRAQNLAKKLGLNLQRIDLGMDNSTSLVESVIKNQMIYALVMEKFEGIPTSIGFGGTLELGPQSMCFYHDTNESFQLFHQFATAAWANHELLPYSRDEVDAYATIMKADPSLRNYISSCMTSIDKKQEVRKITQSHFGVVLDNEYQCGTCYKCAEEKVIMSKFHGDSLPKDYEQFCKAVLIDKCVFEEHNMNGLVAHKYLTRLGITSVTDLLR